MQEARAHLQQALNLNPRSFAAHYRLGLTQAALQDPKAAADEFQAALDQGATEPEVHMQLAKALRSLGRIEAANQQLKIYQQVLQDQQNRALAMSKSGQGDKEMVAGEAQKAVASYREALQATPDDAELNFKLAAALDKLGEIPGERAALERAVQLNPDLAPAENQLGFLDSQSGDAAAAEKHFRAALRATPTFAEAWVNLGATLGLQSKFMEAREAVDNALRLEPGNPQALLLRDTISQALAQH
jgi:tetratricopeptide (TPR) repeat protein